MRGYRGIGVGGANTDFFYIVKVRKNRLRSKAVSY